MKASRPVAEQDRAGGSWSRLDVDQLTERLPGVVLGPDGAARFSAGIAQASEAQLRAALAVLAEAAVEHPELDGVLLEAGGSGSWAVARPALELAPGAARPQPLVAMLLRLVVAADASTVHSMAEALPRRSTVLAGGALAIMERRVAVLRRLARSTPSMYAPVLAEALTGLSLRLTDLGRLDEALTADLEAIKIHRRLA